MGHSNAYRRFKVTMQRTRELMTAGSFGIDKEVKKANNILEKFNDLKGKPGRVPKDYKQQFEIKENEQEKKGEETKYVINMDDRTALLLRDAIMFAKNNKIELNNHLYSIMLVYAWGSFETYLLMLFEELFEKNPNMLKSSELISYKEVIENERDIFQHLINKELEKIGHFSLDKYLDYLKKKLNLVFPTNTIERLNSIYLLRNIIAHNTGIVNKFYLDKIPKGVRVRNNEILLSKTFIEKTLSLINTTTSKTERFVIEKFNKNKA